VEEKERKLVTDDFGFSSATNINPRVLYNTSYDQYRDLRKKNNGAALIYDSGQVCIQTDGKV
jgi:hypothetical protein